MTPWAELLRGVGGCNLPKILLISIIRILKSYINSLRADQRRRQRENRGNVPPPPQKKTSKFAKDGEQAVFQPAIKINMPSLELGQYSHLEDVMQV